MADELEQRVRRSVSDDEHLATLEHLLDLGVLRQLDREIAQRLVIARGDDVADIGVFAHEHDRHAVDTRDLGDSLHDREEDPAEVEVRRERLRHLEHDLGVTLLALELIHRRAQVKLPTDAGDELDRSKRLAHEVVRSRLEGSRDLGVGIERREHEHRYVTRLGTRAQDAQDLVAVWGWHHEVEQHQRRTNLVDLLECFGARASAAAQRIRR